MVKIIDENYEIFEDDEAISSELKEYLISMGLGIGTDTKRTTIYINGINKKIF